MTQEEIEEDMSWSDVPDLVLSKIQSRLFGRDVIVFSCVCKAWNTSPCFVQEEDLSVSPCLVFPGDTHFFHPLRNLFFQHKTILTLPKGAILAQNYGWLLMARTVCPFFFNPLTNQRIGLSRNLSIMCDSITFSSPPTSQDCEIVKFSVERNKDNTEWDICVMMIKRGEKSFKTKHTLINSGGFQFFFNSTPTYFEGEYYCMERKGNMIIYNSKKNEHRIIESPEYLWNHFSAKDCSQYMFEGEGHLFVIFVACTGKEICMLKFNHADMVWEKVDDLEDRMVFVSRRGSFIERCKVREISNKIYFPRLLPKKNFPDQCLFYCMANRRYYTVEGSPTSYEIFHESTRARVRGTWIKMNNINPQTCEQKLAW